MNASILLLTLAMWPALCWTMAVKSVACPMAECTCSEAQGSKRPVATHMAICNKIPTSKLPNTITTLRVNGDIGKITRNAMSTINKNIQTIDLSDCKISSIDPGSFDKFTDMTTLRLSSNMLRDLNKRLFTKNTKLRAIYLNGNRLGDMDPATFTKLNNLTELYLQDNRLTKIPSKMPHGLTKLVLSNNNLGTNIDSKDLQQLSLKELDLCGNPIEKLPLQFFKDIHNVQELSLGDRVVLPHGCAQELQHITSMELIGAVGRVVQLDQENQDEIGAMKMLTYLRIANYKIESLSFLNQLKHLMTFKLQHVTVTDTSALQHVFSTNPHLAYIDFDRSPKLAESLLSHIHLLSDHYALRTISLRKTDITSVAMFHLPNVHFRLDISENPLNCDCSFAWLKEKADSLEHVLHSFEKTICQSPAELRGKPLSEALHTIQCNTGPKVVTEPNFNDDEYEDTIHHETPMPPLETTMPSINVDFTNAHETFPNNPVTDFTNVQETFPNNPVTDFTNVQEPNIPVTDFTNVQETFPNNPVTDFTNVPETLPNNPVTDAKDSLTTVRFTDKEFPAGTEMNVMDETTIQILEPVATEDDNSWNGNNNNEDVTGTHNPHENGQDENNHHSTPNNHHPTSPSKIHTPEHPGHNNHHTTPNNHHPTSPSKTHTAGHQHSKKPKIDDGDIIYIVLGTILLVLVVAGMVLIIIYWKVKTGSSKVEPENEDANIERMPTFKKLQAKEDTALIQDVKK